MVSFAATGTNRTGPPGGVARGIAIAPSLLTGNFAELGSDVQEMEAAGADRIHWDVMDGCFVPNLTFGPDIVAATRGFATIPFEAHLMVANPDLLLERWAEAGCQRLIVHAETCTHLHRTLGAINELGMSAGVALNPATAPWIVNHVLDLIDLVLVMTVNPGFGGQLYISSMEAKVRETAALVEHGSRQIQVAVDGGISSSTIAGAYLAGARVFVSGSAVYRHPGGKKRAIDEMIQIALDAENR
ncbi:MAG TPA: ribulose-phosphate 3-epimerase [Candidatus Dormibacteraeota bacterium]|nr:ribulose-phosphate 3-epimerase [Candidatus Dormibacteraeota bacterium]